jgi:hypothetical protein
VQSLLLGLGKCGGWTLDELCDRQELVEQFPVRFHRCDTFHSIKPGLSRRCAVGDGKEVSMEEEEESLQIIFTPRVRLGLVLFVLSYLFGWPFLLIVDSVALARQDADLAIVGTGIYAVSWVLLGLSIWLAGRDTIEYFKRKFRDWRGRSNDDGMSV